MSRQPFDPSLIKAPRESRDRKTPYTVSEVTALVKDVIATAMPGTIHVVGELSNFKRHGSGHLYWTLKDGSSELACVMWRSQAATLKFDPSDGMSVVAGGRVDVFERSGRYQLYVRKLEPKGIGALELAFRQLCEKLQHEGLFEATHKKPLPRFPQRIAVITSGTGAALCDILRTFGRRFPCVDVLVYPVAVQGERAKAEIAHAIRKVNASSEALGGIDLMIVGRGGGSLEDLWAFNEEVVARAIFASRIPIISAVGHEVDVTIADLVADVRAATPTAAAELAVPVLADIADMVAASSNRLMRRILALRELSQSRLAGLLTRVAFAEPQAAVHRRGQVVDEWANRVHRAQLARLRTQRLRIDRVQYMLDRIAPHAVLLAMSMRLRDAGDRLAAASRTRVQHGDRAVVEFRSVMDRHGPARVIALGHQVVTTASGALRTAVRHRADLACQRLSGMTVQLAALSYRSVLNRGYSITRTKKSNRVVRSTTEVGDRDRVVTELADGTFESEVVNQQQLELFE